MVSMKHRLMWGCWVRLHACLSPVAAVRPNDPAAPGDRRRVAPREDMHSAGLALLCTVWSRLFSSTSKDIAQHYCISVKASFTQTGRELVVILLARFTIAVGLGKLKSWYLWCAHKDLELRVDQEFGKLEPPVWKRRRLKSRLSQYLWSWPASVLGLAGTWLTHIVYASGETTQGYSSGHMRWYHVEGETQVYPRNSWVFLSAPGRNGRDHEIAGE